MNKNLLIFSVILTSLFFSTSCEVLGERGSGNVKREERKLPLFSSINVGGAFDVFLTQGPVQNVFIEADDNLLPLIKTEVTNGTLVIETTKSINHPTVLKLHITVPMLENIDVSGACDLETMNQFKLGALNLRFSGATDSKLDLAVDKLDIHSSGGSKLLLKGTAGTIMMDISGAVKVEAFDLPASKISMGISGAGEANINVKDELIADISGAANVRYKGNPTKISQDISGAGSVKKAD